MMILKIPEQEIAGEGDRKHRTRTTAKPVASQDNSMEEQRKEKVANFPHHKRVADYLLGKCVGEGSFAKVRLGLHAQTGEEVAVKVMSKARARKDAYVHKNLRREGRILQMARHANIVQVYDILETDNNYYLVTEFCRGGELIDMVTEKGCLPENDVRKYMTQLVSAVSHLHAHGIVHRDLKVENLLLNEKGNLKIIDFGLSNIISGSCTDPTRALATQCGSPAYAAPELLAKSKYGPKVDVWSIGVITYALLVGKLPFTVEPFRIPKLCRKMLLGDMNPIPAHLSGNCRHFIRRLLVPDPDIRPSISQVMKMIWINTNGRIAASTVKSTPSRNDTVISSTDIDSEVVRELTNKYDFEYSEILNCVRKNRPGEVLTTYCLVLKQKLRNRDLKCNTDVIGSDGNLDHGHESDSKSSDDEVDGLNDVDDDVTDGIIFNDVFKEKKLYKPAAETDATKLDVTTNPELFCNDIIIDEFIKRYTNDQEANGKEDDIFDYEGNRLSKQVTAEIHAGKERDDLLSLEKSRTRGDESGLKIEQNPEKDEDSNDSSPKTEIHEPLVTDKPQVQVNPVEKSSGKLLDLKTSKGGKSERKSRGPSSMRDFVKTMSRAREALQRRGRFGSNSKHGDKKKNDSPAQVGKFKRLSSTNDDGVDNRSHTSNEKASINQKQYDYRSPAMSRNLWNNYDTKNTVNTRLQLPDAPPPTTPINQQRPTVSIPQRHNLRCPLSPSSGYTKLRLLSNRRSTSPMTTLERELTPHRISTFRSPNSIDMSIGRHGTPKSPDCMFPRITLDRPRHPRDLISNLTPSNLTPRYNYTATPRSSLTSDMTSRAVSNGVKDIIDRFHALLHDDDSTNMTSTVSHRLSDPAAPAMTSLLSSNTKTLENVRHIGKSTSPQSPNHSKYVTSPNPYGNRRCNTQQSEVSSNDNVPKTNAKTFASHFGLMERRDPKTRCKGAVMKSYLPYKENSENDFKNPVIWYKSAV